MTEATYRLDDLPARIAVKITVDPVSGCWKMAPTMKNGYAKVWWQGSKKLGHRVVYMILVGPIPPGLELDHVKARGCTWRSCCWPAHLEPVTRRVNTLRCPESQAAINAAKTHCPANHPLIPGNLVLSKLRKGLRICLICARISSNESKRRARERRRAPRLAAVAARRDAVARLTAEGLNQSQVARRIGWSHTTVRSDLDWLRRQTP